MKTLGQRIKELRTEAGKTQREVASIVGLTPKMISFYELDERVPPNDILGKLADLFGVTTDYLLGREGTKKAPTLTPKDERDIQKRIETMLDDLEDEQGGLMFSGEPINEETKELLAASLRNTMEMSKIIAKKKYTPKKYRKDE